MQTRTANARARDFSWNAAYGLLEAAQQSVDAFVRAIALAKAAGADSEKLEDLRISLLDDIVPSMQRPISKMLDENGARTDLHQIDTKELRDEPQRQEEEQTRMRKHRKINDVLEYQREDNIHAVQTFCGDENGTALKYNPADNEYYLHGKLLERGDLLVKDHTGLRALKHEPRRHPWPSSPL